jgi:hypothetical protein
LIPDPEGDDMNETEQSELQKYCRQYAGTVAAEAAKGFLSLQVPAGVDKWLPSEWFCNMRNHVPTLGKQEGFLFLTRRGYEANKELILGAFENSPVRKGIGAGNEKSDARAEFEDFVEHHFWRVYQAVDKLQVKMALTDPSSKWGELTIKANAILKPSAPAADVEAGVNSAAPER